MQREQRELERDAHGQEGERRQLGAHLAHIADAQGEVGDVERAGGEVEQADADDDEGRADRAHDQVLVGGHQRPAVAAQGDQHVGRQRGDLQEHEDVERIAGDRDAEQAGEAQQPGGPEQIVLVLRDLLRDALPRIGDGEHAHDADQHQDRRIDRVDAVLDAPGGCPASQQIGNGALGLHADQQCERSGQHGDAGEQRDQPRQRSAAQQHAQRRGHERHHDLQRGEMVRQAHRHDTLAGRKALGCITARLDSGLGARPPRSCRTLRGCARPAPGRARGWPRRRRWR